MKKFLLIFSALMVLALTSCAKLEGKNEFGWYTNYQECLSQAKKSDKRIIHIISRDEDDHLSADLKKKVLYTPEFAAKYENDYLFCETDISHSLFMAAKPDVNADESVKKDSKKYEDILEKRMRVVTTFGIIDTPTLYIISPEGYVIKDFRYLPFNTVEDFSVMLNEYDDEISYKQGLITKVNESKGIDKVKAIDELYENTPVTFRYMLTELMREVEKLDKDNTTGLVGKFVMAIATSDAMDAYISRTPEKIVGIYEECAKHPSLSSEQRQQTYFAIAHVIGTNTPTPEETEMMIKYLQLTIDQKPDSEIADRCRMNLAQIEDFKLRQKAAEERKKAEAAAE